MNIAITAKKIRKQTHYHSPTRGMEKHSSKKRSYLETIRIAVFQLFNFCFKQPGVSGYFCHGFTI